MILNFLRRLLKTRTLHILSDSHGEAFKFIDYDKLKIKPAYCIVPGATASGIANPNSKTQALSIFRNYIYENVRNQDYIIVQLGEVDCGFIIWLRSKKENISVNEQLNMTLQNYNKFLLELSNTVSSRLIIVSAIMPTILDEHALGIVANLRREVQATLKERTDLTLAFNRHLKGICLRNKYQFISLDNDLLDENTRVVKKSFRSEDPMDHHLNTKILGQLLEKKILEINLKANVFG